MQAPAPSLTLSASDETLRHGPSYRHGNASGSYPEHR